MSSSQATSSKKTRTAARARDLSGFCPRFHRAVELIGRRWTGAIVRALCGGALRFNELLSTIPGLSDRLLTERLRELEREHIVSRVVVSGPPVRVRYSLTERGIELEPIIRALGEWADLHVSEPADGARGKRAMRGRSD
jgi:DNA-binding HxlR family transcriptional regulator